MKLSTIFYSFILLLASASSYQVLANPCKDQMKTAMEAHKKAMQDLKEKKCEDFKKSSEKYETAKSKLSGKCERLKGVFMPLDNMLKKFQGKSSCK